MIGVLLLINQNVNILDYLLCRNWELLWLLFHWLFIDNKNGVQIKYISTNNLDYIEKPVYNFAKNTRLHLFKMLNDNTNLNICTNLNRCIRSN